jgi:hypothetical protein
MCCSNCSSCQKAKKWLDEHNIGDGNEGEYEGICQLVLGYAAVIIPAPVPRKENYVYFVK